MIEGVVLRELKPIPDEREQMMQFLRSDWDLFEEFDVV
jgi:hypothetical protein